MVVWNLAAKIDPSGAQTGGRAVEAAAQRVEAGLRKAERAGQSLSPAMQQVAQSMGVASRMASSFLGPGRAMAGVLDSMSTAGGRLWKTLVALPGALTAINLAMAPFRQAKNVLTNAIGVFSDREIGLTRLAVMKRSFTEAREDFRELQRLSDITPFTSRELLGAYTTLQPFIRELGGMEKALRLVGDAASGTQRDLEWVTRWTARLYGSAQSGRALGEELEGLADLGVITQKTQSLLLEMGKANEKGRLFKEIWGLAMADMSRFTGMMELQSRLWSGKLSTLREKWETIQATVAEPIVDALKPVLDSMIQGATVLAAQLKGQQGAIQDFMFRAIATIKVLANPSNYDEIWETMKQGFAKGGEWLVTKASEIGTRIADAMMEKLSAGIEAGIKRLGTGALKLMPSPFGGIPWGALPGGGGMINASFATAGAPVTPLSGRSYSQQMPSGEGSISGALFGSGARQTPASGSYDRSLVPGTGNPSLAEAWLGSGTVAKSAAQTLADKINDEYRALRAAARGNQLSDSDLPKGAGDLEQQQKAAEKLLEVEKGLGAEQSSRKRREDDMADAYQRFIEQYGSRTEKIRLMEHELIALHKQRVITYQQMTDAIQRLNAEQSETGRLMLEWGDMATQMDRAVAGILDSLAGGVSNAFADIMSGTKSASDAFAEMGLSIINDINRIISRMLVQWAIQKLVGLVAGPTGEAVTSGIFGATSASVYHDGTGQTKRSLPSAVYSYAPRYHSGLAPGEVPAVLEKDEAVLTRNQQAAIKAKLGAPEKAEAASRPIMIVNAQDRNEIAAIMASRPDVVLNILGQNAGTVRRLVNVGKT